MEVVLRDGVVFCVSDSLKSISSWVALEQEDWFEKELPFLRQICEPEWNVIDIGANHGVYSLALAHRGISHVWAFEPTSEPTTHFRRSVALNGLGERITIVQKGVSSSEQTGEIRLGSSSELNSRTGVFSSGGRRIFETVQFASLDHLAVALSLPAIDLVKLDAEGEEPAILEGGQRFFAENSPLVMFEFIERGVANLELPRRFRAIGYDVYALVPGLSCLRRVEPGDEQLLDSFALNLFACKPDRAARLAEREVLINHSRIAPCFSLPATSVAERLFSWAGLDEPTAAEWKTFDFSGSYGKAALAWCAAMYDRSLSVEVRYAFLIAAQHYLVEAVGEEDYHPAVTILLIRVLSDLGQQKHALMIAGDFAGQIEAGDVATDRPVPAALSEFDTRLPAESLSGFLHQSVLEYCVTRAEHSGRWSIGDEKVVAAAMRSPERTAKLERYVVLNVANGTDLACSRSLRWLFGTEDNANHEIWVKLAHQYEFYPEATDTAPGLLMAHGDNALTEGRNEDALRLFRQASDRMQDSADLQLKLGVALMRSKRPAEASEHFRCALKLHPAMWPACNNLGLVLAELSDYQGAENAYRKGLAEHAECFDLHVNFATLLRDTGRYTESLFYLRRAASIRPGDACVHDLLGSVLIMLSRTKEAIPVLQRATELDPGWAQPWNNLGRCHFIRGNLDEAERCYDKAIELAPAFLPAWTNRVMVCNYRSFDPAAVFELHRRFGVKARELAGTVDAERWQLVPDKARRLRIGFVSGDFRRHSVSYFVEGLLKEIDRRQFQLHAYFSHERPDNRTLEFKQFFHVWRDVKHLSDSELAKRIVDDRIDVLVDLTGHTTGTRLGVFAEKPAPVQLTWIGYPNTTGLDSIDYRLTDAVVDPEGEADGYYTEALWRLPRPFLCYSPLTPSPEVGALPSLRRGCITFGSFNSLFKLGDETLVLWSKVLRACPESRLLLKSPIGLGDDEARATLRQRFAAYGIDEARVEIQEGIGEASDHLDLYNSVDIALDPFPYHGTTTTFESLWMGVPVISLAGSSHASRVGTSILVHLGLPELVAVDADDFVRIAGELAADQERLAALRESMRQRMRESPLLDARGMARDFTDAVRQMWSQFCDSPAASHLVGKVFEATAPGIRLIVGGRLRRLGWTNLDAVPGKDVDIVADVRDLSEIEDGSCAEIYCANVLSRLGQGDILQVIEAFYRILAPGGRLGISVPDLDALAWLFVSPQYPKELKFEVMRHMFGFQMNEFEFNKIGLNVDFLVDYLRGAGFSAIEHVESLDMLDDVGKPGSIGGVPISLNLVAMKPAIT